MKTVILVESYPAKNAFHYCRSLLEKKHLIDCIFFYGEGVKNISSEELTFFINHKITLFACIKSLETCAINTIPEGIEIAGLSTFIAHALTAGKVIQFKK